MAADKNTEALIKAASGIEASVRLLEDTLGRAPLEDLVSAVKGLMNLDVGLGYTEHHLDEISESIDRNTAAIRQLTEAVSPSRPASASLPSPRAPRPAGQPAPSAARPSHRRVLVITGCGCVEVFGASTHFRG